MKKRILSLALAVLMVLALAAPAYAAEDDWQEFTLVYGNCDIHFSKCRFGQTALNIQWANGEGIEVEPVTIIYLAIGSTIDTCFNEKVTEATDWNKDYLLEEFEVGSLEELIGVECYANADGLIWDEENKMYWTELAYGLDNGTVTDYWNRMSSIPYLRLYDGSDTQYIIVGEDFTIPGQCYTDVSTTSPYYDAVKWAADNMFAKTQSAVTFGAGTPCSRGELVEILWKALGSPEPTSTANPFTDVKETDSFYKAVLWAVENGITNGTSATTFAPDMTVKRCDAMTFIWRAAGEPASSAANPFTDIPADAYYTTPVLWAVENGITNGTAPTTFSPANPVTRAQMVTFLYRQLAGK